MIFVPHEYLCKLYISLINAYVRDICLSLILQGWNDFSSLSFKQKDKIQESSLIFVQGIYLSH
jgi:hypothetical protein